MNTNDVLNLVNAGFTKAEIMALAGNEESKQPAEQPAPEKAEQQPAPAKAEPQQPAPEKAAPELPAEVTEALANINATLAKLQAFAVKTDAQPPQPKDGDYKSILSSIYNNKKE